jgi:hypothetical protein
VITKELKVPVFSSPLASVHSAGVKATKRLLETKHQEVGRGRPPTPGAAIAEGILRWDECNIGQAQFYTGIS